MSSRRQSREFALQMLFQQEINLYAPSDVSEVFWSENRADAEARQFAQFLYTTTIEHREEIDGWISRYSKHWRLERMPGVDRNVLRIAVAELLHSDTPEAVILDEAIEIAKRFSTDESGEFVNGVLDAIVRELRSKEELGQSEAVLE